LVEQQFGYRHTKAEDNVCQEYGCMGLKSMILHGNMLFFNKYKCGLAVQRYK